MIIIITSYVALFTQEGRLKALPTLLPLVTGHLNHSLNHLSSLGSIQPVQEICATRLNQSQEASMLSKVPLPCEHLCLVCGL